MALVLLRQRRRQRAAQIGLNYYRLVDRMNPFDLNEDSFVQKFRLSKDATLRLIHEIKTFMPTGHNGYAVELQALNSLRILASGSFQRVVSDGVLMQISESSACRFLTKFIDAVMQIIKSYICFPTSGNDLNQVRFGFYEKFRFPNVIGAIDCTHILINKPVMDSAAFINRKCQYSINVQMVCDSNLRVLDVVARWPGSSHDSFIWNMSGLRHMLASGRIQQPAFLLGDSGYPLENWLLTPYRNASSPIEETYNRKHRSTRNVIEKCFGVIKARFRILSKSGGIMLYAPDKCCKVFIVCAALHNICLAYNSQNAYLTDDTEDDDDDNNDDDDLILPPNNSSAERIRNSIAYRFQAST